MAKTLGDRVRTAVGILLLVALYGARHGADRHDRSWMLSLGLPPVGWYYALESTWHSDGRKEFCTRLAQCRYTLLEQGVEIRDFDGCMRGLDIVLTGESANRLMSFERFAKNVDGMTCPDLAEWARELPARAAAK